MIVTSIKTHKITKKDTDILKIIDRYIINDKSTEHRSASSSYALGPKQSLEGSVLAITSKIVSILEGRMVKIGSVSKSDLIKQESELYLSKTNSKYDVSFAINNGVLAPSAGIDESNSNGYYILWPKDPQESANKIRAHIANSLGLREFGVIITDSKTTPLRWGVTGTSIAHSGFLALNNYIGKKDIFGRKLEHTKVNVAESLAAAAVFTMGEGSEQSPIAIISNLTNVKFQNRNPNKKELKSLFINMNDDLYAPLLTSVKWKKGEKKSYII